LDIPEDALVRVEDGDEVRIQTNPSIRARSQPVTIQRLADRSDATIDGLLDAGRDKGSPVVLDASAWTVDELPGPNITDKESVLGLARIAANAYVLDDDDPEWFPVGGSFNYTDDFGWDNDGLRGHIFADQTNMTVIVGIKGTSPAVFDGSETTTNDKINDNLFFSCCCGQGGQYMWKQVCDCQTSAYKCNSTCVAQALKEKNRYYYAAQEIYRNVTEIYPDADIWLVGHSLGGSTASLVALTYGLPVVTFEAPGEAMAAARLGLPTPPGYQAGFHQQRDLTGGHHFGHTADPVFMGTCNTATSACSIAGYAMQSVCHTGKTCVYDTVADYGWRVGVGNHRIRVVLKDVLSTYDQPARCEAYVNCTDCFNWEYFESNHSDTTTSTSKTSTSTTTTRTSTCKTPGWWGCLDETTTSDKTTTTSHQEKTHSPTTTSCETPGWFGCKDQTTTTSTVHPSPTHKHHPNPTSSTTCHTPGWFGCKDPSSPTRQNRSTSTKTFRITRTITSTITGKPPEPTSTQISSSCARRGWFGWCKEWRTATALEDGGAWKGDL
jgi:lipase ATG15